MMTAVPGSASPSLRPGPATETRWAAALRAPLAVQLHWILRVGVAAEFVGHGLAGLHRTEPWISYFGLFGISRDFAFDHMFYVTGSIDILLGLLVLYRPMRSVLAYMAFWGFFTAWLRPLADESWFELVERGANYGMPLAFLLLAGWGGFSLRRWFARIEPDETVVADELAQQLLRIVQVSIALLLVGHGGLGVWADKAEWFDFFGYVGVGRGSVSSAHLMQWVGFFEIALGLAVLVKPLRSLLVFILVWKVGTELLRPLVGQPNFQFIERSGDYVLPAAALLLLALSGAETRWHRAPAWNRPPTAPGPVGLTATQAAFRAHLRSRQPDGGSLPPLPTKETT